MRFVVGAGVAVSVAIAACSTQSASPGPSGRSARPRATVRSDAAPSVASHQCWGALPPGVIARCGLVTVPERRDVAGTEVPSVRLAVMVLHAGEVRSTQPPTIVLGGGPGQHTIALIVDLLGRYRRLKEQGFPTPRRFMPLEDMRQFEQVIDRLVSDLARRDLVVLDQRGTGYSEPSLACHGERWDACRRRLVTAGVDLAAYNSLENARDVNDVRVALGYARANLQAGSYGTRLALEVMRRFPHTIRAAVLDGVSPPQLLWGEEAVARYGQILNAFFARCGDVEPCREAYPQLDSVFYDTVTRLNARPASVRVGEHSATLDGDDLRDMVWNGLFDVQKTRWLPAMIWKASQGDTTLWGEMIAANASDHAGEPLSWGMHYSVECAGSWAFQSPQRLADAARGLNPAIRAGVVRTLSRPFEICAQWNVPALPSVRAAVQSDVPALLLSGELDPGTPPAFAEIAARTLPHSYRYVLPFLGHTDGFTSACHASIVSAFLDDPSQPPPSSCIAAMDRGTFAVH
jgi:pimeloyl-ACP methyl ester carboxylesterase